MKRMTIAALAALALLPTWGVGRARAQGVYAPPALYQNNPYQRGPISPYLNLARPGTLPGINYYGLVRPQIQTGRALQNFQQELLPLASGLNAVAEQQQLQTGQLGQPGQPINNLPTTGHTTRFYSYGTYFPVGNGSQGGTLGGTGTGNRPSFGSLGGARAPRR
jgi:hypothetical protein